jgi:adenosylcobinamide kinase/adenosylcobinamide-phosphate guanylyltransferase
MSGSIIYVSGGARSGKSSFAQKMAEQRSANPIYLATAQSFDDEMTDRIKRHRLDRDERWRTHEEPIHLVQALSTYQDKADIVLIDCLTLWLSNIMLAEKDVATEIDRLISYLKTQHATLIFVSNEVGMGIVPDNPLARTFRDAAGRLNQLVAATSCKAYVLISGLPLCLK